MARIRSIKPEFFTSEVIASLPISARLTFIGIWTHVDDNGVCIDNPKLITAALWPLEEDPREALQRTSGDLQKLSTAGLIQRYEAAGRHYLFVASWDEHQKVSHPSKPRYPRPTDPGCTPSTSTNTNAPSPSGGPPENLPSPPEDLAPEQGAGSREQGTRSREQGTRAGASARRLPPPDPRFDEFWAAYPRREAKADARRAWDKAIKRATPETIISGAERYRDQPGREPRYTAHPATWLNGDRWDDERTPVRPEQPPGQSVAHYGTPQPRPSTADQRFNDAMALAAKFAAEEAS